MHIPCGCDLQASSGCDYQPIMGEFCHAPYKVRCVMHFVHKIGCMVLLSPIFFSPSPVFDFLPPSQAPSLPPLAPTFLLHSTDPLRLPRHATTLPHNDVVLFVVDVGLGGGRWFMTISATSEPNCHT